MTLDRGSFRFGIIVGVILVVAAIAGVVLLPQSPWAQRDLRWG